MELLILLASRPGELVTRAEIAERLWSSEVFVDTEHGINTAVRKLRYLLRDDPEKPQFIQTVTGMGYRFVAPLTIIDSEPNTIAPSVAVLPESADAAFPPESTHQQATSPDAVTGKLNRNVWIGITAAGIVLFAVLALTLGPHPLAARLLHRNTDSTISSIAVLPLDNLSGDRSQEYFADGMTDELITMLARNSTLRVTSRTSVMQYKGAHKPLPEIAQALNVDAILEGSVSRSSNQIHMTLQLIRADTDSHLWAQSYDRSNNDISTLPAEAALAIAERLKSTIPFFAAVPHVLPEAHDAYLQGRYFWFGDNYPQCTASMQKAISLQPDYALAWAGLADCYGAATVSAAIKPAEGWDKAYAAASKALELDGTLAAAHHSLAAYYYFHSWDWPRAEAESRQAIAIDPNYAEFHHLLSYILRTQNRDDEALAEQKRATELDPFSRPWALGAAYTLSRQCDAAIAELKQRAASHQQNFWLEMELAKAYWCKGMKKESAMHMKQGFIIMGDNASANAIEQAWDSGGAKAVATWELNQDLKEARTQYVSPITLAFDYAALERKEETLRTLEDAYRERSSWLTFLQKEPAFDFLHADPRYRALVKRIGLSPAY
jgi:TolB-like protein/DNA-binding winged helix-turn-helix (wHTH) protein